MQTIYSLTVNFIERFLSNKDTRSGLETLEAALSENRSADALNSIDSLLVKSGLEIHDLRQRRIFVSELNFIAAVIRFKLREFSKAREGFIKCLALRHLEPYSSLFLALSSAAQGNHAEARGYITQHVSGGGYNYFKLADLKFSFEAGQYNKVAQDARNLIESMSARKNDIKLLPPVEFNIMDPFYIKGYIESLFELDNFLYEILYIAAESNFYLESYETAFEYYKEASFCCKDPETQSGCFYKMACSKMRVSDFITARGLLEKTLEIAPGSGCKTVDYALALMDLANLYEYHFSENDLAIDALIKYAECAPEDPEALYRLASLLYARGRFNEAVVYLNSPGAKELEAGFECAILSAKCHYSLKLYSKSLGVLDSFMAKNDALSGEENYAVMELAAKNLIMLNRYGAASEIVEKIESGRFAGENKFAAANFTIFFNSLKNSPYVICARPSETPNAESADGKKSISLNVYKGFLNHGRLDAFLNEEEKIKNFVSAAVSGDVLIIASRDLGDEEYAFLRSIFDKNIIIHEKHLSFINPARYAIHVGENPLGCKNVDETLCRFIILISLLGKINIHKMPRLFINPDECADGTEKGFYSGILKLYELFRTGGRKFNIFLSYARAVSFDGRGGEEDKSRLWPFVISFKNIDMPARAPEEDPERFLINGCADIFIYNYLRERKEEIDSRCGVHIFTEASKTAYYKKILEFILKKLGYAGNKIFDFENIGDVFCLKKVNELISLPASSESESFDILSVVLSMSSGARSFGGELDSLGESLAEKIKFRSGDCNYESCPEKKSCRINAILARYCECGQGFYISPFSNFFFAASLKEKPAPFIEYRHIFSGAAGFYRCGESYHRSSVSIGDAWKAAEKLLQEAAAAKSDRNMLEFFTASLNGVKSFFDDFAGFTDDKNLIKKFCARLLPCSDILRSGETRDPRLQKFFEFAMKCLNSKSFFKARLYGGPDGAGMSLTNENWSEEIIFDRHTKKIYFTSEEDPGGYYDKKLAGLFKFFRRADLSQKYFQAAAIMANVMIQSENEAEYKNILNKFASNSKKTAVFFLDYPDRPAITKSGPETVYRYIDLVSDIEAELIDIDCAVINYHYRGRRQALSMLASLKNIMIKYNANIFWMIVSTELAENAFARGSEFYNIERLKFYSNEIEYMNAFYGDHESMKFLNAPSPGAYYDNPDAPAVLGKYDICFSASYQYMQKIWQQTFENIIDKKIRTICAGRSDVSEKTAMAAILMSLHRRFKKHVIVYLGEPFHKTRFDSFLYRAGLFDDNYESEKKRVIILQDGEFENFSPRENGLKHSETLLINYQARFIFFNSIDFNPVKYRNWLSFEDNFDHAVNIISISPREERFDCGSYERLYSEIARNIAASGSGMHIVCSQPELAVIFKQNITSALEEKATAVRLYCISYENAAAAIKNIIEKSPAAEVSIHLTAVSGIDGDLRLTASYAREFNFFSRASVFNYYCSGETPHLKLPEIFYNEAAFLDAFISQFAPARMSISLDEIASYLPASVFSKSAAARCLAILAEREKIKLCALKKEDETGAVYETDASLIGELSDCGVINIFFDLPQALNEKFDFRGLLKSGLVSITDRYELMDKLYRLAKDPLKISVSIVKTEAGVYDSLKKLARIRKNMLRCLYDIEGFKEGKPIALPISDFHDMAPNDFYYMREFSFLKWHGACSFTRSETNSPQIRRIMSQIQIERITENIEHDLNELYFVLTRLAEEASLEKITGPAELIAAVKSHGRHAPSKLKENASIAYLLKLLKHLFLYGFINLKIETPFETDCQEVVIETGPSSSNLDYKSFVESYNKMHKADG
ncbi:MAG: hypothetical protein BWY32_02189 [bacterium ADurb.Bin243]|nr:MAG: hypothetical protein BWY32_02189 [bacterium ADurb.Bin243]